MLRTLAILGSLLISVSGADETTIQIKELKREKRVDFGAEIIPIFQRSCLACHNATDAKGDLVMENPAAILKGGETGPAVVPGNSSESLLLKAAAHQSKPFMPPKNNKADAKPLTPEELGLVKLWIDEGATGVIATLPPIRWQNLANTLNPIQAVAITADGQFAACGRGNQIDVYELPTGRFVGSLIDGALNAADRDMVESLAFAPDGLLLASGSYRSVKLWRMVSPLWEKAESAATNAAKFLAVATNEVVQVTDLDGKVLQEIKEKDVKLTAVSGDGKRLALVGDSAAVKLYDVDGAKMLAELKGDRREQEAAEREERILNFAKSETGFRKRNLEAAEKQQKAEAEALKKVTDAMTAADKVFAEKSDAAKKSGEAKTGAEKALNDTKTALDQATENQKLSAKLIETADSAVKSAQASAAEAEKIMTRAQTDREEAYTEIVKFAKEDKTAEAKAAIDQALVVKLSFEHARNAKTASDKALADATANSKSAIENKGKAEKTVADLNNRLKDADGKLKAADKQLADATAAAKQAETVVKNTETNLKGTADVAKKADEAVGSSKSLLATAEKEEKDASASAEAAKKRSAETQKKVSALFFAGPWLVTQVEGNLRFYAAESGRPGPVRAISGTALGANGESIFAMEGDSNLVKAVIGPIWKLERQIGDGSEKSPLADRVLALDFSADGKLLVTGGGVPSRSGELKIWKVEDGALLKEFKDAHSDTIFSIEFSPNQKFLASGGADKLMKVFEVDSGKFVRSFEGHTHHVLNVSWMRHGRTLASGGADSAIKIWDFESGEQKKAIAGASREITSLQFLDAAGEALAASGDNQLRLLREDGNNVRTFSGASDYTQGAAITPDGRFLVAGGHDSQFRLWDGNKGDLLKTFGPPSRDKKSALANASGN